MEKQHSQCQIAYLLELNRFFVCQNINRYKKCGSVENRPRSGSALSLSSRAKRRLDKRAS